MRARSDVASIVGVEPDETMGHHIAAERTRLGLGERYLVFFARYDARKDIGTLMEALALLRGSPRPAAMAADGPWPPRLLLVNASPEDRAALAKAAARESVGEMLVYAPFLEVQRLAALVAGARASVLPALSEASGVPAIESLAAGTPVVASAVGALPEIVGAAGILVEPHDARRLAEALRTVWSDDAAHARLLDEARLTTVGRRRTWSDVARETRAVYAAAAWPAARWSEASGPSEAVRAAEEDEAAATGRRASTRAEHSAG
jgi:glycosyltransferase involved in cell wall biosynthesis